MGYALGLRYTSLILLLLYLWRLTTWYALLDDGYKVTHVARVALYSQNGCCYNTRIDQFMSMGLDIFGLATLRWEEKVRILFDIIAFDFALSSLIHRYHSFHTSAIHAT